MWPSLNKGLSLSCSKGETLGMGSCGGGLAVEDTQKHGREMRRRCLRRKRGEIGGRVVRKLSVLTGSCGS